MDSGEFASVPDAEHMSEHPYSSEIEAVEKEIREHPGNNLGRRLKDLDRVFSAWGGFSVALSRLLKQCETHEETIVELVIRNVGDTSARTAITTALDQALIAYVAGLGAVIDHARIVLKSQKPELQTEYAERLGRMTKAVPGALFLAKLRTFVLHYVVAPWEFTAQTEGSTTTARVFLNSRELLRIDWPPAARDFIESAGEQLHLSPLLHSYLEEMHSLIAWLLERCWAENAAQFQQVNGLIAKRNLLLTGGVSDGRDWEARVAHMEENLRRAERGEPQTNFETGLPFDT